MFDNENRPCNNDYIIIIILTKLAGPIDLLLIMVGPLANVDMDGRSVPLNAISKSFGGCCLLHMELEKMKNKNKRSDKSLI